SGDYKSITTIGIAENVFVSKNTEEIARFVGRRTVYSIDEIESLCKHGEVLSILFRQVKILKNRYTLKDLKGDKMLNGAPQSITKIDNKVKTWLENRLKT
ncbi:MAG: GNAT family N-acetyltransferase, partial [Candidatus Paceibacterota bacterium]